MEGDVSQAYISAMQALQAKFSALVLKEVEERGSRLQAEAALACLRQEMLLSQAKFEQSQIKAAQSERELICQTARNSSLLQEVALLRVKSQEQSQRIIQLETELLGLRDQGIREVQSKFEYDLNYEESQSLTQSQQLADLHQSLRDSQEQRLHLLEQMKQYGGQALRRENSQLRLKVQTLRERLEKRGQNLLSLFSSSRQYIEKVRKIPLAPLQNV